MATIDPTPEYVAHLRSMVHSPSELKSKGFVQEALTQSELLKKARCTKCNKRPRKPKPWKPRYKKENDNKNQKDNKRNGEVKSELNKTHQIGSTQTSVVISSSNSSPAPDPLTGPPHGHSKGQLPQPQEIQGKCFNCNGVGHRAVDCPKKSKTLSTVEQKPPKALCQWHPGARRGTTYSCCHAHVSTPGCRTAPTHTLPTTPTPALTTRFQVHPTPSLTTSSPEALAVAIDCEMGTALDGESELIRVTVLDYFTGAALVDSLVWPDVAMEHYNTRWSGVTRAQIRAAKREGTCILGVEAARREVWRYVGVDTIVVGHDVKNDLGALRWAHGVVVDSILVEDAARKALKRANAGKKEAKGGADYSSGDSSEGIDRAAPGDDREEGGRKEQQAAKPKMPGLSLKDVTKLRLARDIQKRTHDSFEDALASRDIVHHYAMAGLS